MAESKVILTQTVANLGHSGDVVAVRSGYARNYLIPQGLAFAWTKGAEAQIVQMKRARLAKAVATREDAVAAKAASRALPSRSLPRSSRSRPPATSRLRPPCTRRSPPPSS